MAFLFNKADDKLKVILRHDDAIDIEAMKDGPETFEEKYRAYLEDLDESKLVFHQDKCPTRFVLKKGLKYAESYKVKSESIRFNKSGDMSLNAGSHLDEVRFSLVGIENPPGVPECIEFKQDGAGGATMQIMEMLIAVDAIDDLYFALQSGRKAKGSINKKK